MLNKNKETCSDKQNPLKPLIYMCLFFLLDSGSCSWAVLSSKLKGVTMPCSPRCVMFLCSDLLISAKLRGGHPPHSRPRMCNANTNAIRKISLAEPAHRTNAVSAQTGNGWSQIRRLQRGARREGQHLGSVTGRG